MTQEIITIDPYEKSKEDLIAFVSDYQKIVVTDETFEEAKKARLVLRDLRYSIQATEKKNTDKLNEIKNTNWNRSKELIALITPAEERIDLGIKAIEQRKAAAKAEKERIEREKVEAEIRAEQERLAKIEQERLDAIAEAQRLEAERLAVLQAEMDERNRAEQERLNKIKAEQEAKEREMQAERDKIEKEQREREAKIKAEQAEIDRQRQELIRQAELEKAKKEAAERARKEEIERQNREESERVERERLAKIEAARKEALKPFKEKMLVFADRIQTLAIEIPTGSDEKAAALHLEIGGLMDKLTNHIRTKIETL
jgi:hypothetical protein